MIDHETPLLLDARQTAALLGVSRNHLLNLDTSGRLGPMGVKLGRRRLWAREELQEWVRAGSPARGRWQTEKGR